MSSRTEDAAPNDARAWTAAVAAVLAIAAALRLPGLDAQLWYDEIATLVKLAKLAPQQFPTLRGDDGEVRAADIEFGFRGGKLALLQIRPLNESKRAQRNAFLVGLDDGLRRRGNRMVELSGVPEVAAR